MDCLCSSRFPLSKDHREALPRTAGRVVVAALHGPRRPSRLLAELPECRRPEAGGWELPERALPAHRFAGEGS